MKSLFKIFTIFTPKQLWYCGFIVLAMLVGAMLEAVGIGAILPLISLMGQPDFLSDHQVVAGYVSLAGITTTQGFIMSAAALLIILYIIKNAYLAWENKLQIDFAMKNQIYYAGQLYAGYLRKPYIFHLDHNTMTLLRNVSSGSSTAFSGILVPTLTLFTELVTAVTIWVMLAWVDAFTAIVVAGIMGVLLYAIMRAFRRKISEQGTIQNDYSAVVSKWLNQGLGAIKETKVMRKEAFFSQEFDAAYQTFGEANRKFSFINQLPRLFIETTVVSGLLVLIITKLALGSQPMDIVPLLGVLALAAFRLMPSANRIVNLSNGIKFQMPLFDELYPEFITIRNRAQEKQPQAEDLLKLPFGQQLCVENLCFRYPAGQKEVLQEVSFTVPKGAFLGVVGPSGAGKTTFVDILLGLLQPTSGRITVDGQDINQHIRAWQANLSYVPQSIYLIDGTVRENIALGVLPQDIDDGHITKVMQMAELYDFVQELPDKADSMVGERGVKLSGGQRQRIGIARALYQQPEVLVLDEATSALDNETEKSITDTILKLKGTITIISIAHRVSTLTECDFKIEFADGKATVI